MKKIIAIVLVLTFVLALASCGTSMPALKEYKTDVDVDEFYEELKKKLELDDEYIYEESLEAGAQLISNATYKTAIEEGKTYEDKISESIVSTIKYDEKNGIAQMSGTSNSSETSYNGNYSSNNDIDIVYFQDGDDLQMFDNQTMTYTEDKDDADGVFNMVDDLIRDMIEEAFDGIISYELLESDTLSNIAGAVDGATDFDINDMMGFGKDVDIEYYIDGNVYTVVYVKETENDGDEYDTTSTTEITIQIVFADSSNTSIVRQEKTTTVREYKNYTETDVEDTAMSVTLKLVDSKLTAPDTKKFVKLK